MHLMPQRGLNLILLIFLYRWFSNMQGSFKKYSVAPGIVAGALTLPDVQKTGSCKICL